MLYFYFWKFIISLSLLLPFHLSYDLVLRCWTMLIVCMATCAFLCVAVEWACGSALSSFPTLFVPWAPAVTSGQRYGRLPRSEVAGSLPVCQDQVGQGPVWNAELSLWSQWFNLSVSLSLSGYVADAATGGAWGFCHSDWGGAQCKGLCGEGLQACGEDNCVSANTDAHTQSYFWHKFNKCFGIHLYPAGISP